MGFVVDAIVLYALLACSLNYFVGRLVSFFCAAYVTWFINRRFTFAADESRSAFREWANYMAAMSVGGLVNFAAYYTVMSVFTDGKLRPLLAVAAGSIAGMIVNFVSAKMWVFRQQWDRHPNI
ncbi:GtrA family protein [Trinickia fusca]|uniref:GtrA family protein n=2 Tax=Trinickia fusca TaxID=2419777 RepID=A0A494XT07_9BURK|nr:GtrA family protein [Trinickia fusca]